MIEIVSESVLNTIRRKPGVTKEVIYVDVEYDKLDIAKALNHLINNAGIKVRRGTHWLYSVNDLDINKYLVDNNIKEPVVKKLTYPPKPRKPALSDPIDRNNKQDAFKLLTTFGSSY